MLNYKHQILKLTEQVGQLNGKVDQMDKNITVNFASLDRRVVDMHNSVKVSLKNHENRLNTQENETSQMKGKAAGIAFVVSLLVTVAGLVIAAFKLLK